MDSFLGHFIHTIDSQRRVAIPREWRARVGDEPVVFYLFPGRENSIQILPSELYEEEILQKSKKVSFAQTKQSRALAIIGSTATRSVCDRQGRVNLSKLLMQHANLSNKAVMVGSLTSIRVMSPEQWAKIDMTTDEVLDEIEKIMEVSEN